MLAFALPFMFSFAFPTHPSVFIVMSRPRSHASLHTHLMICLRLPMASTILIILITYFILYIFDLRTR
ncbi:hypothetical protein FA13DRAFT_1307600 [Coprinellus micaceus]|uniref:Uncharacterized protein n=1 Tax=Coprinellus micaceus TaxID=71717 RepID=A0A4Y7SSL0_COPMI|nr:hypothetical protein FA13DRAFT_1307600 [Coprinellus micaceus]